MTYRLVAGEVTHACPVCCDRGYVLEEKFLKRFGYVATYGRPCPGPEGKICTLGRIIANGERADRKKPAVDREKFQNDVFRDITEESKLDADPEPDEIVLERTFFDE